MLNGINEIAQISPTIVEIILKVSIYWSEPHSEINQATGGWKNLSYEHNFHSISPISFIGDKRKRAKWRDIQQQTQCTVKHRLLWLNGISDNNHSHSELLSKNLPVWIVALLKQRQIPRSYCPLIARMSSVTKKQKTTFVTASCRTENPDIIHA